LDVNLQSSGTTTVRSELPSNAFTQNGLDTMDTAMESLILNGTALGYNVSIRAGAGNGYFQGLSETHGQVQDHAISPLDGNIDFQANSFFDVFFDLWIDFDIDGIAETGEVLRNFDEAMRMQNTALDSIPPTPYQDTYSLAGIVLSNDPNIGTFNAAVWPVPPSTVDLYWVAPDGSKASPEVAAMMRYPGISHDPVPDGGLPAGMLVCLFGLLLAGAWRCSQISSPMR
jgi:hypothetical protein